ncbi:MAG: DNA repair protein RecO [Candidatus Omnitrophica bacterium]|nr:DNA repair protein RecO [Candidatus Omnitrophota bacterium]
MAIQKTEAFVLRSQPFRSSSLIVTTFSRSFGKIKGIAKGVRREGTPHPSTFEPFTLLEIVFYEKIRSELHLLSEASVLKTFESLRGDLEILATAYYLVEMVDQLTEPHDPHEPVFELLHFAFQFLPSLPPSLIARFFEVRILNEVGLLPHFSSCVGCGQTHLERIYFSVKQGAVFCPKCRQKSTEARLLTGDVVEAILFFMEHGFTESAQYPLGVNTNREMEDLVGRFLTDRLGRWLVTKKFLNQVRSIKAFEARSEAT